MLYKMSNILYKMSNILYTSNIEKIGLVTGVFDLMHQEHQKMLVLAQQNADILYIGIESDARVKELKGIKRPYNKQETRKQRIQSILPEAIVEVLPENFGLQEVRERYLREKRINRIIVSQNDIRLARKKKQIEELGGKLTVLQLNANISSTKILEGELSSELLVFAEDRSLVLAKK